MEQEFDELWESWFEGEEISPMDAVSFLTELGASDPDERVDWMNSTTFDREEICALAEVDFRAVHCSCGEVGMCGDPKDWAMFQGVNEGEEIAYLSGEINGASFDVYVCAGCATQIKEMLGL